MVLRLILGLIVALGISPINSAQANTREEVLRSARVCEAVSKSLSQQYNTALLMSCLDFYFFHQDFDPEPGSFNAPIKLGYRVIEVSPNMHDAYLVTFYLLWSKWDTWFKNPEDMPDGERRLKEGLAVLLRGAQVNPKSSYYFAEAAYKLMPVAQFRKPELFSYVISWFQKADSLMSQISWNKIRIRIDLAHSYRLSDQMDEAKTAYQNVLAIDPYNEIAKRFISCLDSLGGCKKPNPKSYFAGN